MICKTHQKIEAVVKSLSAVVCVYMYVCVCVCVRERERERSGRSEDRIRGKEDKGPATFEAEQSFNSRSIAATR